MKILKPFLPLSASFAFALALGPLASSAASVAVSDPRAHSALTPEKALVRRELLDCLARSRAAVASRVAALKDEVRITDFASLAETVKEFKVWDRALEAALAKGSCVVLPPLEGGAKYYFDRTVTIPGSRRIVATGATVAKLPGSRWAMFVNAGARSGRYQPVSRENPDETIAIEGGRWESWCTARTESPASGTVVIDGREQGGGGNAYMFFSNVNGLSIRDASFDGVGGFTLQISDCEDVHLTSLRFRCHCDGIHVNGGVKRLWCDDISGSAGDDLIALNACDWEDRSTLSWGPIEDVLCENIRVENGLPWFRILPGVHRYSDENGNRTVQTVDCPVNRLILRNFSGIEEIKMYLQTQQYQVGRRPDSDGIGRGRDWFIEDATLRLGYATMAVCSNVDGLHLRNLTLNCPGSGARTFNVLRVGPMHARNGDMEVFDPYLEATVRNLTLENVRLEAASADAFPSRAIAEIAFDRVNNDDFSSGWGRIEAFEKEVVTVTCDHTNALYAVGEEATFTVTVADTNGVPIKTGRMEVVVDNFGPGVIVSNWVDLAVANPFTVKGRLEKPGFLRLGLRGGELANPTEYLRNAFQTSVGYDPQSIRQAHPCPDDFDAFWAESKARLGREVPPDVKMEIDPAHSNDVDFTWYHVSFATFGRRVWGHLIVPKTAEKDARFPVKVEVPGAGYGFWSNVAPTKKGWVTLFMSVFPWQLETDYEPNRPKYDAMNANLRAKGLSCGTEADVTCYHVAGIGQSREDYFYHPVILGIDRAVDWLWDQPFVDRSRFVYTGTSQGGAFGLVLMALNRHFTRGVVFVPAMAGHFLHEQGMRDGWPRYSPEGLANAPYFDGVNFAARIRCPIRFVAGFADWVCPPQAVWSAFNACSSPDKDIVNGLGMSHNVYGWIYKALHEWAYAR